MNDSWNGKGPTGFLLLGCIYLRRQDYRKDTEKWSDLDAFVRSLAARTEYAHQSMDWFLEEAHKRVLALHGMSPTVKAEEIDSSAEAKPVLKAMDRKPVDRKPPLDSCTMPRSSRYCSSAPNVTSWRYAGRC